MTKTEKKLVDLCELINQYFEITHPQVKLAIESQLKEQTKEIVDSIKLKSVRKLNVTSGQHVIDELDNTIPLTREEAKAIAKSKEKQQS